MLGFIELVAVNTGMGDDLASDATMQPPIEGTIKGTVPTTSIQLGHSITN